MLRWQPLLENHQAILMTGLLLNFGAESRQIKLFPKLRNGNFIGRLQ